MQGLSQEDEVSVIVNWVITNFVAYERRLTTEAHPTLCGKIKYKPGMVNSQRPWARVHKNIFSITSNIKIITREHSKLSILN